MSEPATEREALSRACVKTMRAKGFTFKTLADEIGVSLFITAAALLGQMALPKEVAARVAKALGLKEAEAFLAEIPYRGSLGWRFQLIRPSTASTRSCRYTVRL